MNIDLQCGRPAQIVGDVEGVVAWLGLIEVDRRRVDVLGLLRGLFFFLHFDGAAACSADDGGGGGCLLWRSGRGNLVLLVLWMYVLVQ